MAAAAFSSFFHLMFPPTPGQSEDHPLNVTAVPGLTTLLDTALFRSNEGQLTATICSSRALLACWLDVKHQSQTLLQGLANEGTLSTQAVLCEAFARQCLESSMDAIERLSTDKLAQSANLSDPYDSISSSLPGGGGHYYGGSSSLLSGVGAQGIATGILESKEDTGRRQPIQRRKDCWESPRLYCPDYVWADDAYSACQRWIRSLSKHSWILRDIDTSLASTLNTTTSSTITSSSSSANNSSSGGHNASHHSNNASGKQNYNHFSNNRMLSVASDRQSCLLIKLVQDDLPMRLYHFRQAMDAEAVVTKRLYLVKCEFRAPFRAFLEAHQSLLRAPPMDLVDSYIVVSLEQQPTNTVSPPAAAATINDLKGKLQSLLQTPELVELLALEKECEQMELDLGQAIFPFSELARSLDHKKARLKVVSGIVEEHELASLQETVRRLKCILCRKGGSETSTGIRPLLLDFQSVPRDDELPASFVLSLTLEERIDDFLSHCTCLSNLLLKNKTNLFWTTKTSSSNSNHGSNDIDFSVSILKGCTEQYDSELLKCQLLDWFAMVKRQRLLLKETSSIAEDIRQAEMKMSIAGASEQSLKLVKERLLKIQSDREQRLEVLKEMVEELCVREMNLYVQLQGPAVTQPLVLAPTSALGFLGTPLQLAGEPLPVG